MTISLTMKRRRFGAVVALLALSLGHSLAAQEVRVPAATRHSLWRVEGKSKAVYLLGSIHLLKASDYPLSTPIVAAFSNAPIAAFETDIAGMEEPEAQQKILSQGTLPPGRTLKDELTPAMYASFSNHLAEAELSLELFDRFKPALAAVTLGVIELQSLGVDPEYGVDQYLYRRARREGKQILPLETVDFQIDLVSGFSRQEGELLLKATLKNLDQTKKSYNEMVGAWQTGDAVKLERLVNEAMQESPALFRRLVTDRSQRWGSKIEELLRGNKSAIVIVGAGHLIGPEGVVELLKRKGWKVTQL